MTALLATLLLATSTNIQISAEVVRSSSISVSQVDSRGGRIKVGGSGYGTTASAVVEASRDVKVRMVAADMLETSGSGVVRVTLYADGAPPSARAVAPVASKPGHNTPVELRREVRPLLLAELTPILEAR
jgi:hypothetical protein